MLTKSFHRTGHRGTQELLRFGSEEFSYPQPYLYRVHPWIRGRQACIGDVHVTQFQTDIVICPKDVHAKGGLVHEVHGVSSWRNIVIGEDSASGELEVG